MSNTVYEGAWDCTNCGQTRIPGSKKECPRCKDPQNSVLDGEEWYLPEGAKVITDAAELVDAHLPSWNCGWCKQLNDGSAKECSFCERPMDSDDTVNRRITYDDHAGHFDDRPDPDRERVESDLEVADRTIRPGPNHPRVMGDLTLPASALAGTGRDTALYDEIRAKAVASFDERLRISKLPTIVQRLHPYRKRIIAGGAAIMIVLLVIGGVAGIVHAVNYYTATVPGTVTVSELHWERKVEVEEYKTLTDSAWEHPSDARILGSESKIRSYRTVHDGWRTESYTDQETRYRTEAYTDSETRYRSESYSYDCSYVRSEGNGKFTSVSRTCTGTRQVPYTVPVQKTRQVPYQVPVQKTRQIEITHQEPVYDTWYTYQVDRWVTDRWVVASDTTSQAVVWPEVTDLSRNDQPGDQPGEERVGDDRSASYTVVYADAKGVSRSEQSKDDAVWRKLAQGQAVPARYYERDGSLASVDWQLAAPR